MCEARIEELLVEIRERRLRNLAFAIGRSKTFAGTEYSITQDRPGAGRRSRDGFAAPTGQASPTQQETAQTLSSKASESSSGWRP
jgi:hypothetical protein